MEVYIYIYVHNKNQPDVLSLLIYSNKYSLHITNRLTVHHQQAVYCTCSLWYLSCIHVDWLTRSRWNCVKCHTYIYTCFGTDRGGAVGWGTALQVRRSRVRFPMLSLESFWAHYGPGVDSASNRNEYREYFLEVKSGRCVGLTTLPPSCADCLEIWEPQPPGTLWACSGL